MLIRIVSQYLKSHKRLIVPQLGAFIVKEPGGGVVFSELLRRDDGILRGLLREEGLGDLEAAGEIDRFVFEVRHAVEHGGEFRLKGFGVMRPGPNGTILFRHDPLADAPAEPLPSRPSGRTAVPQPERLAEAVRNAFPEPHISRSAKMDPDPSLRGLRYGKPPKNTDAYTYVDRPPRRRRGWGDLFIWLAILVAALAVAAIAFGYYCQIRDRQLEAEYMELPAAADGIPETAE